MDLILQHFLLGALLNECLHLVQFCGTPGFKSTRIMKNKSRVAPKYQFVLNIMASTLANCQSAVIGEPRQCTVAEGAIAESSTCWQVMHDDDSEPQISLLLIHH